MPDYRRRYCKPSRGGCDKPDSEVGPISWRGLCETCGKRKMAENVDQLEAKSGPRFTEWRRAMAACVGGVLLDDSHTEPYRELTMRSDG